MFRLLSSITLGRPSGSISDPDLETCDTDPTMDSTSEPPVHTITPCEPKATEMLPPSATENNIQAASTTAREETQIKSKGGARARVSGSNAQATPKIPRDPNGRVYDIDASATPTPSKHPAIRTSHKNIYAAIEYVSNLRTEYQKLAIEQIKHNILAADEIPVPDAVVLCDFLDDPLKGRLLYLDRQELLADQGWKQIFRTAKRTERAPPPEKWTRTALQAFVAKLAPTQREQSEEKLQEIKEVLGSEKAKLLLNSIIHRRLAQYKPGRIYEPGEFLVRYEDLALAVRSAKKPDDIGPLTLDQLTQIQAVVGKDGFISWCDPSLHMNGRRVSSVRGLVDSDLATPKNTARPARHRSEPPKSMKSIKSKIPPPYLRTPGGRRQTCLPCKLTHRQVRITDIYTVAKNEAVLMKPSGMEQCNKGMPTCSKCTEIFKRDGRSSLCRYDWTDDDTKVDTETLKMYRRSTPSKTLLSAGILRSASLAPSTNSQQVVSIIKPLSTGTPQISGAHQLNSSILSPLPVTVVGDRPTYIARLRKVVLHCLERDLDIMPRFVAHERKFFKSGFAVFCGYDIIAPEEFLQLFKTDIQTWRPEACGLVPLLIKDGIISFVRPGEKKVMPFFIMDSYLQRARDGIDGWEEILGPQDAKQAIEIAAATQQKPSKRRLNVSVEEADLPKSKKRRTEPPKKSPRETPRTPLAPMSPPNSSAKCTTPSPSSSPTAPKFTPINKRIVDIPVPRQFMSCVLIHQKPRAATPTVTPPSQETQSQVPSPPPAIPPLTTQATSVAQETPATRRRRVTDILKDIQSDIRSLEKLQDTATTSLVRETIKGTIAKLRNQRKELLEVARAEDEVMGFSSVSPAVRESMMGYLLREAESRTRENNVA